MKISIRNLEHDDFFKGYLTLLSQLSVLEPNKIIKRDFDNFVNNLNTLHQVIVANDIEGEIIGSMTVIFEQKVIHNFGKVCHIEDVVVDKNTRGYGIGKHLIEHAINIATKNGCYKVILDCSEENIPFYNKCNFEKRGAYMYHKINII